jgi:hypothetical protein
MQPVVAAGAGFLLAVLWFDLMFDVSVLRHRGEEELPEAVVASIAGYYRRVTTDARPMNRLVVVAMAATLTGIVVQLVRVDVPRWVSAVSLATAAVPIVLAATRTVRSAVRLGTRSDPPAVQTTIARSICREHLFCVVSIAVLLVTQVAFAS